MSAQKRTGVRSKKTTKRTVKKTATKAATKARTAATKRAKKATKKTTKRTTKKVTTKANKKPVKRTTKKVAVKTAHKRVKRTVKRPKNAAPQSVREARYGGHDNTLPSNPNAPGRLLGRSFTLSAAGVAVGTPFNTDAIAVALARLGGVAIMLFGLGLTWHLYNLTAAVPSTQTAAVIESVAEVQQPSIAITKPSPLQGDVPVVVTANDAVGVYLLAQSANNSVHVLGAAHQQTAATWEFLMSTEAFAAGTYTIQAIIAHDDEFALVTGETITIATTTIPVKPEATASSTASSSVTELLNEPAYDATSSMPVLFAPTVHAIAPYQPATSLVIGEGTPNQPLEVLLLRDNQRATTTVQTNGWWALRVDTPGPGDTYELFAQANQTLLSGPLDFSVINGRLVQPTAPGVAQLPAGAQSDDTTTMLLWYLLAAVSIICIGVVLVLIGHHLHYLEHVRKTSEHQRLTKFKVKN